MCRALGVTKSNRFPLQHCRQSSLCGNAIVALAQYLQRREATASRNKAQERASTLGELFALQPVMEPGLQQPLAERLND